MPSLRRYGQNDPSSPLALFGLQRTPELLLYFKICCAPPPTALSLCLRLPSSSSSALFLPYLPPERALLPISPLPRSSLPRMRTTPCATWPTPVTRWLVSTGPSSPRKLGKSLAQGSDVWAGPQARYSDLLLCPDPIPGLDISAPKVGIAGLPCYSI